MTNSSSSTKRSIKEVIDAAKSVSNKKSAQQQAQQSESASLQDQFAALTATNEFAKIMLNSALSPEQKRDEMAKALAFDAAATKEQNRAKIAAFSEFKEYLQEQRKVLNREGIKLQDTEAFAELQSVIDEMTKASIDFQDKIKPLLDVLTAVFDIRKNDKITDVYREIEEDRRWQKEQEDTLAQLTKELATTKEQLTNYDREIARLMEEKGFFGFGATRTASRQKAAEIDAVDKKRALEKLTDLTKRITEQKQLIDAGPDSGNPELVKQKQVLKGFLDLTKDENRDRQKLLIDAAVKYVDTSDSRLKSVLGTLGRLGKHAEVVSDTNGMLRNMHLIMDDSLRAVAKHHEGVKGTLEQSPGDESSIARMTREEKLQHFNEHRTQIDEGAVDITNSIGGLTKHAVQIQSYKDTLRNETNSTKRLHLEGVSQMGEQLMSVLSAISAAATSESRSLAANNFAKMAEQNQTIISQEVVKNATNIELEASQISKLVGELQDYGEVLSVSNEIANQGYNRMRETVDAIRKVSGSVQDAIKDFVSDRADSGIAVGQSSSSTPSEETTQSTTASVENPFAKLNS